MFSGVYTALITPFKNNKIDEGALRHLIEFQIKGGVDGIVVCGTTGESPALSVEEQKLLIDLALKIAGDKIKIIAGSGSNSTAKTIEMTSYAAKAGVAACLVVAPYYNKPNQEGLYQHFKAINDHCSIPLIVYNVPGRSVVNVSDETLGRLAKLPNIIGIKDATGDLARIATARLAVPASFSFLSGEDATLVGFNAMGGNGVISVTSNIAPRQVVEVQQACERGNYQKAKELQDRLTLLNMVMFCETNPIPVKYAASLMGLCSEELRLPLCEPSQASKMKIKKELENLGLLAAN